MVKTFYIIRHGQTLFNLRRKIQGDCDSPLTELGIKQAEKARKYIEHIKFDKLYSSTSERASDTLEILMGTDAKYTRLKGLKEMSFGLFEGESEDLNPTWEDGYDQVFPKYGGELRSEVKLRMKEVCTNIMEQEDHNTVLAVSHAGASFHFLRNWIDEETQLKIMSEVGFPNCCIVKYEYQDKQFKFIEIIRVDD